MIHVFTFNNYHFHTMKNLLSKILSLFILFFVCAQSAQAQGGGNELSAPADITASSTATLTTFDITSDTTWRLTLSPTVDWVTNFAIIEGDGDTIIVITHKANTDTESREATFTLSARDVLVDPPADVKITLTQQAPINPLFSILYTQSISASSDATESVYNTGDVLGNWRFSLSSESSWITNISVAGSPGHPYAINGRYGTDIRITHTANTTGEVREATFTYVDENDFFYYTITLSQEAGATDPVTTVDTITTQVEVAALSIERFTFDGDLIIKSVQGEDRITDLSPLSNITEVTGDVIIDGGAAADGLTSLKGLRQLQTIGGSFTISNHNALTALDTFPSLQSIGGSFRVFGNSVLTHLGGFSNLASIGSTEEVLIVDALTGIITIGNADEERPKENISLFIMSNPLLEDCCVLTSFFSGATHAVSGEIRIGNNAIGCSDEGRIEISCSLITLTDPDSILSEENFSESKFHYLPQIPEEFRVVNTVYTANVNPTDQTFTVGIDIDNSATGWIVNTTNVFSSSSDSLKEVEDFITFSNTTGMGDGILDIRVAENTDIAARTAVITFTPTGGGNLNARYLVITQEAAFPTLTISSSYPISHKIGIEYTMNIPPEPGTLTINIALGGGAIGWEVSAQNPSGVITLPADPLDRIGRGDGTVDIIIQSNTSSLGEGARERSAIFSFIPITTTIITSTTGDDTIRFPVILEITQLVGDAELPTIDLSGTGITAPSGSEMNYTTNVNDTAQTLSVNIDIGGSTTGWTVSKTSDPESFVTLPTTTSGAEDNTVDITIAANTSTERSATIIFTSTGGEGNPVIRTLVITQKAGLSTFMLSSIREYVLTQGVLSPVSNIDTDDNINYTASVWPTLQTLDVTVDIGGSVTGWEVSKSEDADFISLVMRDDRVGITIAPNATIEKRSATLTFTSTGDTKTTFTRYLEITQTAGYPTLTLSSTPTPFSAPDDVVDYTLNVDSSSQDILVNIDLGGSAGGWSVYKKGDFISFSNSDTTGTEDETVTFLIESNRSTEVRSALITFLATGPTAAENDTVIVDGETVIFARTITLAQTVRITQLAGNVEPPTLTLSGEGIILPPEDNPNHTVNVSATEKTLDVKIDLDGSATGWMVSKTLDIENFITLPATTMGIGDSTVGIAIAENSTFDKRSATITFTSTSTEENSGSPIVQTLVITQEGMTTLTLTSPNTVNIPNTATDSLDPIEITFIVENGATGWMATLSGSQFIRNLDEEELSGNAGLDTIKAYAIANTGAERTATFTLTTIGDTGPVDSKTITIKQAVGPHKLTLSTFSNVDFRRGEENDTVIADAMTTTFAMNINIGDGAAMGWEATKTSDLADFITLPVDSVVVGNGDGRWVIMMDPNTDNMDRTATIIFTTTGDEGDSITRTLVITQKRPLLLVSSDTLTVGFRDTTIAVSIDIDERSVTGWEAKETSDLADFITFPENSEGNSDGTLDIMVKANFDTLKREAIVTFIPVVDVDIIPQTFVITQEANPNPPHTLEISSPDVDLRKSEESDTVIVDVEAIATMFTVNIDIGGSATGWKVKQISDRGQVMTFPVFSIGDSVLGDGTLDIMIESSNINIDRTATITFTTTGDKGNPIARTLVIRQDANPPTVEISSPYVIIRKGEESDTAIVDATEQSLTINIALGESTADWEAIGTSNFISLDSVMSLDGDTVGIGSGGILDIRIAANPSTEERRDTITFATTIQNLVTLDTIVLDTVTLTRTLIITQLAVDFPTLTILGDTLSAGGIGHPVVFEGGTQTFTVAIDIAGSGLENWEISEVDEGDFVTFPNSTTGTGDGEVEFTLSNNESTAFRTAAITFTFTGGSSGSSFTQTLNIVQYQKLLTLSGIGVEPLSGDEKYHKRTFPHTARNFDVSITLDDLISDWQIASNDKDRFVILPESTTGTGNDVVTFRILNNSSTTENRADTITFEGRGEGIEIVTRRFLVIEQDALPIIGIVDPGNKDVTYEAGSVDIEITTGVPSTTWNVNTTASFVTSLTFIPTGGTVSRSGNVGNITLRGKGTGILRINYSENTTGQTREGTLSVTGSTDEITITQAKLPDHIHVGDVTLTNQEQVNNIRNTLGSAVTVIDGYLQIGRSTDINNLDSLRFLTEITGNFFIGGHKVGNSDLTNIGDFPSLQKIGGGYSVAENSELIHGGNFPVLESIGDKFIASGGTSEEQNAINVLHGYFFIRSNSKLESLGTFPRLKRIATSFTARAHDSLRFLYEFPSLISIGTGNPYVPSEGDFPGNTSIVIEDNDTLTSCCVLRNFFPGEPNAVSGGIYIGNGNAVGCNSTTEITDVMCPPTIILETTNTVNIANTATAPSDSIAITFVVGGSATGWKVTVNENFVTLGDTTSSVGRVTLKVAVTANTERMSRMATITLTAMGGTETANTTVTITQSGILPTIRLTSGSTVDDVPNTATAPSDSIAITFVIGGSVTGWEATTLEENPFITLSDSAGSEDLGTIKVAVTKNTGVSRMNTIEITTVGEGDPLKTTVAITQRGASPTLMLISDDSETIAHDADDASDIMFTIGGGAERWTATVIDGGNFLTLDPPAGAADATGFHVFSVENNRGEERTNTIVIATVGGTGDPVTDTITVTQEEAPTISVTDPSDGIIAINHDETALQTITFDVGGGSSATGWIATSSGANAVTFNSSTTGSLGRGELRVTPTENDGPERTTTITISTTGQLGGAVTEEVTIIQQGPPPTLSLTGDREKTIAYDDTTAFEIPFIVGGGATGWKADVRNGNREEFITLDSLDRFGGDRGRDTLRVTSVKNTGEERMNSIVIKTVGGIGEKDSTIIVTQEAVPTIKLTTNEIVNNIIYIANHEVDSQTIRFNIGGSATAWTARSDQSFVALDKERGDSGTGIELIARPVSRNDGVEREATITISTAGHLGQPLTAEVTIRHRGAPPTLMLTSKNRDTIAHDAVSVSDITFTVGGGATGWKAKVIGEDKFLTLVDSTGNAGTDNIRVTATGNTGEARIDTIVITTVGGRRSAVAKTITIMQEAGPPISLISDNSVDVANTATTSSDSIEIRFVVRDEATGWKAKVDEDFVTLGDTMGSSGTVTLKAAVTENTGEKQRTATITISTTGHLGQPLTAEVTITQEAALPDYIYTGDITVTTQEQVEALGVSGGALAGDITKIMGNVVIKGSVTDLSIFNNIDTITGYLRAEGLTQLRALSQASGSGGYVGLTNLRMVGGYFIVGQGQVSDDPRDLTGSSNITLDSVGYFPHLDSIGGFFEIRNNTSLDAVGTFPVLRSIGGRFRLRYNHQLLHIPDFDGLVQTEQEITIEDNNGLITVGSFPRLATIGGDLNFSNNPKLTMRGTYPVLRSIGRDFKVDNCDKLRKINDFPSLTTIKGKLQIQNNDLLGDCCGLLRLLSGSIITGSTTIQNNAAGCDSKSQINTPLTLISSNAATIAYNDTESITIDFTLGCGVTGWTSKITYTPANANFITLSSTGSTTQTGVITIMAAPTANTGGERTATITISTTGQLGASVTKEVTIVQGMITFTYTDDITVETQTEVNELSTTLAGKTSIDGDVTIGYASGNSQSNITDLTHLSNITHITGNLTIRGNSSLDSLNGLNNLQSIGGYFRVVENSDLSSLGNFPVLDSIGSFFLVYNNGALTTLGDFPALQTIGGSFNARENVKLTSFGDFSALETIGGYFSAYDNDILTDLGNFGTLTSIGMGSPRVPSLGKIESGVSIVVENNSSLSTCCVFTEFLPDGDHAVRGDIFINNNAAGCDSESEVNTPLTLISSNVTITYDNTDPITIDFIVGCGVTGWTSKITGDDFIMLSSTGSTTQTGAITIMAAPTENMGAARTATIILMTSDGTEADITLTQAAGPPTLTLSRTTTSVDATAQTITVGVTLGGSAEGWKVTETDDENFITTSKVGDDSLQIAILENSSTASREATLTFTTTGGTGETTQTLVITQLASGAKLPTITLSGPGITEPSGSETSYTVDVDSTAQTLTVDVTLGGSAEGWDVTVTDNKDFIDTLKVGDDSLRITISKNSSTASREATLTFTTEGADSQTLVITQAGGVPTLSITGEASRDLVSEGGSENIEVMSNTTWRVTTTASSVDSLIFTPTEGSVVASAVPSGGSITLESTGSGTLRIVYAANTGNAKLTGTLELVALDGTTELTDPVPIEIVLTQAAGLPTIMLTSGNTVDVPNTATSSDSVEITFVVGGGSTGWIAEVDEDFVTLGKSTGSSGSATLKAAVTANTGVERTAIITLTATTEGTEKAETTIMIKQGGAPPTLEVSIPTPKSGSDTTIAYDATTLNVMFTVGGGATGWEATVIDGDDEANDFLTLVSASGTAGTNTIRVTVDENTGGDRMDTVVITTVGGTGDAADTVIVTQEAVPTIEITVPIDKMISIAYNDTLAQTITFNVGGSATGWTVSSDHDSVALSSTSGSSGERIKVTATFKENKDVERNAKITLMTTGQLGAAKMATVTFTQKGSPDAPKLDVTTPSGLTDTVANTATTSSDSIEIMFTVEKAMGWESMISYGAGVVDFVTLSDTANVDQIRDVTIKAAVTKNEGVERSATITLSTTGQSGFSAATRKIIIVQSGAPPTITESGDATIAYNVTATDILDVITFEVGGGATGWKAKVIDGDKFLTLVDSKGDADTGTIRVTATGNTGEARMDTIVITTEGGTGEAATDTVIVTQEEIPTIEITDPIDKMITIDYNAVTDTTITFNVGGSAKGWTASSDQGFVRLDTMGSSGTGIKVTATPMANTGVERTATITISTTGHLGDPVTAEVTITQSKAPTILVDPHTLVLTSGNTVAVAKTATTSADSIEIMFVVGGGATGWKATVNQTFVTLGKSTGSSGMDTLTLKAAVTANTGAERTATVTITTTGQLGDSVTAEVTITQATGIVPPVSNPPTLMLTSKNAVAVTNAATDPADSIAIMFTVGGGATGWTAAVNPTFVTLGKSTGSSGTVTLKAAVTANAGVPERTATITLTTIGGTGTAVDATITITQAGSTPLSVPTQTPLAIYPNPVGNTLTIEGASASLQISIMDFSGRQVVYSELSTGQNTLDVADLPSGLYVIIVHGEEGEVFTGQIFKK